MLRLVVKRAATRNISLLRTSGFVASRSYHVTKFDSRLKTEYDLLTDYGSYKHTIYTHRLPESTAEQCPLLIALHSRLNLPKDYQLSTLSQALNMQQFGSDGLANNFGLSTLGKNLLSYYVCEHLLMQYPRLPMAVHNTAVDAYMGKLTLAEIGKSWGIEVDTVTKLQHFLSQEPEAMKYGRLRFQLEEEKNTVKEDGVYELSEVEIESVDRNTTFVPKEVEAYASAVQAIIGGLYTHVGENATKAFIEDHVLSRKLPVDKMFQFSKPTRELVRLCDKLGFTEPVELRLIAETGRLSAHAVYVAGAFVGKEKLGEGVGSSLKEAKTRAVVNALMGYYLYSPIDNEGNQPKLPSDAGYVFHEATIGGGDVAI